MKESTCRCGKVFRHYAVGRPKKYCCDYCRERYSRSKIKYVCLNCGKVFYTRNRSDRMIKFCSYKCSVEYKTYNESKMCKYLCQICGETFYRLPGNSNPNIFCSKRCQLIHVGSKSRVFTEEIFELFLKERKIYYKTQYEYGHYFADFYIPHVNLLIELDGLTFHSSKEAKNKDKLKSEIANRIGYNMIRIWCSRKADVNKLAILCEKLSGDDLAEIISAIPKGMINSVNLIKGCGTVASSSTANDEHLTIGNVVPSLRGNLLEGVETRVESNILDNKLLK